MRIRNSIVGLSLISILAIDSLYHASLFTAATYDKVYSNPGMQIRLEQQSINALRKAMESFLPHYINADLNLPKSYNFTFDLFFDGLIWNYQWTDITYSNAKLDIQDIRFTFSNSQGINLIRADFPVLKEWEISAH
jgi:hypothetical protein